MECNGKCCADFCIGGGTRQDVEFLLRRADPIEGPQVLGMIVFIEERNGTARFTCRHWNRETGLCGDYENRPKMCRDYPYGGVCVHCGMKGPEYVEPSADPVVLTES